MWTTVITFGLNKLFAAGDKAIDVKHITKALNRLRADVDMASQDGRIDSGEWAKIIANFIALTAIAVQSARE